MAEPAPSTAQLRAALAHAKVKGRSNAKTRGQLIELCQQYGIAVSAPCADVLVPELPLDILEVLAAGVADAELQRLEAAARTCLSPKIVKAADSTTRTLLSLCSSSKLFRDLLHPHSSTWMRVIQVLVECRAYHGRQVLDAQRLVREGQLSPKRALALVACSGCELCSKKAVRKVYWPFQVRCCQSCLYDQTISDYKLRTEYNVTYEHLVDLPHTQTQLYAPGKGSYSLRFYWKDAIIRLLTARHGIAFVTLADAYAYIHCERLAKEKVLAEHNAELYKAVIAALMDRARCDEDPYRIVQCAVSDGLPTMQQLIESCPAFKKACKAGLEGPSIEHFQKYALRTTVKQYERCLQARHWQRLQQRMCQWAADLVEKNIDGFCDFPPAYASLCIEAAVKTCIFDKEALDDIAETGSSLDAFTARAWPCLADELKKDALYTKLMFAQLADGPYMCGCGRAHLRTLQALQAHARDYHGVAPADVNERLVSASEADVCRMHRAAHFVCRGRPAKH